MKGSRQRWQKSTQPARRRLTAAKTGRPELSLNQPLCMTYPSRNYQTIVSIAIHGFVVVIDSFDDDDEDTTETDVVRMLQLPAGAVGIGINNTSGSTDGSTTRVPICRRKA